jgi:hypothetical protein
MPSRSIATRIALAAALVAAAGARLNAADDLPKAETILDRFVEVTGGRGAYEKTHSEIATGSMEIVGMGIQGKVSLYSAEPNQSLTEIEITGIGKILEGTDGKVAWSLSAMQGPRLKEGEEKSMTLREARFNGHVHWRDLYKQAETAALESVDGQECYKVVLTPAEGNPVTRYFDKQSGLLVKSVMTVKSPMGDIAVESAESDYRKEGGLLMAHKILQKAASQQIAFTVESVKFNAEIPKEKFEAPDEVKALMRK